jgi:putative aldouronate transport system substrate-binding protein
MKRKYLLLLLAALTAAVLLAGCKKAETTAAAASSFEFTGYPMNAPGVTLTWLDLGTVPLNTRYTNGSESPFHRGLAEMTGINIEWIFPTAGTSGAQFWATLVAGGNLPDIINVRSDESLIDEGIIWDITPYVEKWAPNYYKYIKADPIRDKSGKTDTGKYPGFSFFREDGAFADTYMGPILRKDWLDAQGLPIPQTMADWDKTLRVFKEKYGAVLTFEKSQGDGTGFAGAFGAYAMYAATFYVDANEKLQFANIQPQYRDYLAKLNEWWREGILDPDHLTINQSDFRAKALDNKVGASYGAMSRVTILHNDATAANNGAQWIGVPYPTGNDGKTLIAVQGGWGITPGITSISTGCSTEKLEYAMRVLDYAWTEEGFNYWNFGKKGVTWDYDSDGKPAWTSLILNDPDAGDIQFTVTKYGGMRGAGPGIQATRGLELWNAKAGFEAELTWFYPNEDAAYKWRERPGMSFTLDEATRITELSNTINTYVAEMAVAFVTGQRPLSEFNSYVAQINQMGLAELLSLRQASLDRWNAR